MKRVKAACILQTLVFAQKDDCGMTREQQLKINHDDVSRYKAAMDRSRTRYQITEETEQPKRHALQYADVLTHDIELLDL